MLVIAAGVLAVLYGIFQTAALLRESPGNARMQEIAAAIQEGAQAYLKRQYTAIAIVGFVVLVALYFLIRFPAGSMPMARNMFEVSDGGTPLQFRWVPLEGETLVNFPLMPSFLALGLTDLPTSVTHVVHRDGLSQP